MGAVLVYAAALGAAWRLAPALWKRLTPSTLATSGAGLILALLAATAWLPGGTTNGIRLFGQSTSTLLTAASGLAVALSVLPLLRLRILPAWSRYLLGTLAVYGVVSFASGLATATPFTSLLHGGSLWTRLPFWLQGAFVGGLVVLPAGLIVVIMQQGLRSFRQDVSPGWTLQQAEGRTVPRES